MIASRCRLRYLFGALTLSVVFSGFCSRASAINKELISSKAALEGIYQCYIGGSYKPSWTMNVNYNGAIGWNNFIQTDGNNGDEVKLPYGFTEIASNSLNCRGVIDGSGTRGLAAGFFPLESRTNIEKAKDALEKVGYTAVLGDSDEALATSEVSYELSKDSACYQNNRRVVVDLKDQNGESITNIKSFTMTKKAFGDYFKWYPMGDSNMPIPDGNRNTRSFSVCGANFSIESDSTNAAGFAGAYRIVVEGDSKSGGWKTDMKNESFDWRGKGYKSDGPSEWILSNGEDANSSRIVFRRGVVNLEGRDLNRTEEISEYEMRFSGANLGGGTSDASVDASVSASGMVMARGFNNINTIGYKVGNLGSYDDLGLTNQEVYDLYKYYLTDVYGVNVSCEGGASYDALKQGSGSSSVRELTKWVEGKSCYADLNGLKTPENKVYGVTFSESGKHHFNKEISSVDEILEVLEGLPIDEIDTSGTSEDTYEEEDVEPDCRNSGAGIGLSWFLCDTLELAGKAVGGIYNELIEPRLDVEPRLFAGNNAGEGQVPYQAWQRFRDIANVLFVVLLLVVIFSQLTGFGIDNYGIKRILPKLIVSIVLINLSYLICIVAIDASNIVGNGMKGLLDSLGSGLKESIAIDGNTSGAVGAVSASGLNTGDAVVTNGLVATGLAYGLATMVGPVWSAVTIFGPIILVTLLPAVLGALIAIVFLFFLISARQAVVVVLVVLSPLAIVCTILPNTKSVFDRYLKTFKVMLLVYPITSLLVAGGNYVSKLILSIGSDGDYYLALTAMVVGIVPIFFIPSVIKDAFAGLGKIGGTISGLGRSLGSASSKAMQGSDLYKNNQAAIAENTARIKGGFDRNGRPLTGRGRTIANLLSGGAMGRRRNALQYQQLVAKRGSLEAADEEDFMLKTDTENELKRITSSGEVNSISTMQDKLTDALQSDDYGSRARIRAYTDALSSQGDAGREAVKEAYNTAVQTGNVSEANASAFASNIVTNHAADYKNNNRSMFEVARGINDANNEFRTNDGHGRYGTTNEYLRGALGPVQQQVANKGRSHLMTSAKAETMASMDDKSLMEAFAGVDAGGRVFNTFDANGNVNVDAIDLGILSGAERAAVGENAYKALQNTTSMNGARVALLNKILKESGYQPTPQKVEVVGGNTGGGAGGGNAGAGGGTS